jgi:ankyrin repeat protein
MTDKDSEKITTFHRAAFIGNATLLTSFLDEGADVNAAIDQVTPLHLASGQGNFK